ncbi:Glycogenin-1, partial [Operophtera brumata]
DVVTVDVLDSGDAAHLALLQRPELGITFTKIHCWNLTQQVIESNGSYPAFDKNSIFVLLHVESMLYVHVLYVVQNCDELFERDELSAAPDVGWPDCFNSGVFVFKPSAETFSRLIAFAQERGSFDGGDQGLLNSFFSDWARGDISKHLPFLYNTGATVLSSFGQDLKIIHFIGAAKPWLQHFNFESRTVDAPDHIRGLLQLWWDIFVGQVHSQLDATMVEVEEPPETPPPVLPPHDINQHFHYQPVIDPESEFSWHRPEAQATDEFLERNVEVTDIHDPWEIYRGNIPPMSDHHTEAVVENREDIRQYAWDYQHQAKIAYEHRIRDDFQTTHTQTHHSYQDSEKHSHNPQHDYNQPSSSYHDQPSHHGQWHHDSSDNFHPDDNHQHQSFHTQNQDQPRQHSDNSEEYHKDSFSYHAEPTYHSDGVSKTHFTYQEVDTQLHNYEVPIQNNVKVSHVHVQPKTKKRRPRSHRIDLGTELETNGLVNGDVYESDSDYFEDIIPRHPYDGFYLRHQATIDARGRKVCTHEIPPTPSPTPSPPESPSPEDYDTAEEISPCDTEHHSGVAGNLARVVAGGPHEALDDLTRRQGWEAGNIDYMGADSFDKIWAKISQTLTQPRSSPSPPKESPPREIPVQAGEVAKEVVSEPIEVAKEALPVAAPPPVVTTAPDTPKAPKPAPVSEPTPALVPEPTPAPVSEPTPAPVPVSEPVPAPVSELVAVEAPVEEPKKTETAAPAAPKSEQSTPSTPVKAVVAPVVTPEKVVLPSCPVATDGILVATDSPPLANTPSKEEAPAVPAAKFASILRGTLVIRLGSMHEENLEDSSQVSPSRFRDNIDKLWDTLRIPVSRRVTYRGGSARDAALIDQVKPYHTWAQRNAEERRKVGRLQLSPPSVADPLPTPDSEAEDAASLAHAIIASELRSVQTPTVTAPSTPAAPASPFTLKEGLTVEEPQVPTPPVGAVSLAQIGVKPKEKPTTAAQLESSIAAVTDKPEVPKDAPKKKIIRKVVKKDKDAAAAGADAPVPPPRKKEKKPKEN